MDVVALIECRDWASFSRRQWQLIYLGCWCCDLHVEELELHTTRGWWPECEKIVDLSNCKCTFATRCYLSHTGRLLCWCIWTLWTLWIQTPRPWLLYTSCIAGRVWHVTTCSAHASRMLVHSLLRQVGMAVMRSQVATTPHERIVVFFIHLQSYSISELCGHSCLDLAITISATDYYSFHSNLYKHIRTEDASDCLLLCISLFVTHPVSRVCSTHVSDVQYLEIWERARHSLETAIRG